MINSRQSNSGAGSRWTLYVAVFCAPLLRAAVGCDAAEHSEDSSPLSLMQTALATKRQMKGLSLHNSTAIVEEKEPPVHGGSAEDSALALAGGPAVPLWRTEGLAAGREAAAGGDCSEEHGGGSQGHSLFNRHRMMRLTGAVLVAAVALSVGFCCVYFGVANWFVLGFVDHMVPIAIPKKSTHPCKRSKVHFPAPSISETEDSAVAGPGAARAGVVKMPSSIFTGSTRRLKDLLAGEAEQPLSRTAGCPQANELILGTASGNVVVFIAIERSANCKTVRVEKVHAHGERASVASCSGADGDPVLLVSDTAGTFIGGLRPVESAEGLPKAGVRCYGLWSGSSSSTCPVVYVEGPADGCRPLPVGSSVVARAAGGGPLGSLTIDEDDVEVVLIHSAMDSIVLVSIMAYVLMRK